MPTPADGLESRHHLVPNVLSVDWSACDGRGLCTDLLPELLEPDPWGFPRARPAAVVATGPGAVVAVPPHLLRPARRAVHLCPKIALQLIGPPAASGGNIDRNAPD
jgi:ferredoxin